MKLQILVNHYKENDKIVKRFLDSLETQKNIKFETFIVSDGGDIKLTKELLSGYSYPIHYAYLNHSGVCHTRNILLKKSNADYIMFCDIDDMFSKPNGLNSLIKKAEETGADVIGSPYYCEYQIENNFSYQLMEKDTLRVHGKIFKRDFLIKNNIYFPDEMEISGDMSFLWLVYALSNKIEWIEDNFYTWKWNENSVTRYKPFHHLRTYDKTIKCYMLLLNDLIKRKKFDLCQNLVATLISAMYLDSTDSNLSKAPQQYIDHANKHIKKCVKQIFDFYTKINKEYRKSKYDLMLNFMRNNKYSTSSFGSFENIFNWGYKILNNANDILIVGYGVVGHNLENEIKILKPAIYDKYKNIGLDNKNKKYNIAFICVNTPKTEKELCDISEVKNAILEINADIYVIKSTILPGTIDKLCQETNKNIIFSPEYYGETQHCNNYNFNYTILGGDKTTCLKVQQELQKVYDGRHSFRITDAKTAELTKYMENSYLATKVSFCQQFFNLANQIGVNYEELRELFILDPRVNPSHTFVYKEHPYWDSKCLNKDVPAIAGTLDAPLLSDVIKFNEKQKEG